MMLDLAELVAAPGASEAARSMGPGHRLGLVVGGGPGVTIRTTEAGIAVLSEARTVSANAMPTSPKTRRLAAAT